MKNRGFTLLETMVYIAIFGIIMTGTVAGAYQLLEGGKRNQEAVGIAEEGTFINRKINWALTGATLVTPTGTDQLNITRPDLPPSQNPLVFTKNASGNAMTIQRGASPAVPLNSDQYPVSNIIFSVQPASGGRPSSATVNFLVKNKPFIFRKYLRQ